MDPLGDGPLVLRRTSSQVLVGRPPQNTFCHIFDSCEPMFHVCLAFLVCEKCDQILFLQSNEKVRHLPPFLFMPKYSVFSPHFFPYRDRVDRRRPPSGPVEYQVFPQTFFVPVLRVNMLNSFFLLALLAFHGPLIPAFPLLFLAGLS